MNSLHHLSLIIINQLCMPSRRQSVRFHFSIQICCKQFVSTQAVIFDYSLISNLLPRFPLNFYDSILCKNSIFPLEVARGSKLLFVLH